MIEYSITPIDIIAIRVFIYGGIFYILLKSLDCIKWWNGTDEDGNPK